MKKTIIAISVVLALLMALPLATFAAKNGGLQFSDVKSGKWYYGNVKNVCESGLMNGVSDTEFDPNGTLTRGMCATILYRAAEEPAVKSTASFADVKAGKYYTNAVAWAKESGVVNGKTASLFDPNGEVTREEFATMLYRYLGAEDLALPAIRTGVPADADAVAKFAADAVDAMYRSEVVNGRENGEFDPEDDITRAEAAAMVDRFFERVTVRWSSEYEENDHAWITFDQDADGGFFKDVDLSDLIVGYVPEGLAILDDGEDAVDYTTRRFIVLYDPETHQDPRHRIGPTSILIDIQKGDKEVEYSDESFAITEELTINGMAAMLFDFTYEVEDSSSLNGETLEVGDLAFGDKNFTIRLHWIAFCDDGSFKNEAIKVAESIVGSIAE